MIDGAADIERYIPQRAPFVMVGEILQVDEAIIQSSFLVKADTFFVEDGFFKEPGLVENIAQTAAARAGYLAHKENKPVQVGYIGAVKNLEIFFFPAIGDELLTSVSIENQIFDVTLIKGEIVCKGKMAARCEMKIFMGK